MDLAQRLPEHGNAADAAFPCSARDLRSSSLTSLLRCELRSLRPLRLSRREHHFPDIRSALNKAVRVSRTLEGERPRDDWRQTASMELAQQHFHQPRELASFIP